MPIQDFGRIVALNRRETTAKRIRNALKDIELEIEANGGIYAYNNGRITQQEVLRRARLSPSALQKATHPKSPVTR